MGGKSSSTQNVNQVSQNKPWEPAAPLLSNLVGNLGRVDPMLTGTETGALDALKANAQAGNPYAPQIGGVASTLLGGGPDRTGMVNDAYNQYRTSLLPFASGATADSPELRSLIGTMTDDITKRVGASYAAAGRDPSGAGSYAQNVGRGVSQGVAPVLYDAYNQAQNRQLGAINSLYSAGTGTAGLLSGLDQTRLGNQQAGIGAAQMAQAAADAPQTRLLELEAQRRGIPLQNIQSLLGPIAQLAGQFGTQSMSGQTTGTQTLSPAQQAWGWMQSIGSLFRQPQVPGGQPYSY